MNTFQTNPASSSNSRPSQSIGRIRAALPYAALMIATIAAGTATLYAASASSTAVPWDAAMANLLSILTGGTARLLAAIMFVGGAIMWGFSRNEDGMQTIAKVILAAGLIIGALTLTDFLFGAAV